MSELELDASKRSAAPLPKELVTEPDKRIETQPSKIAGADLPPTPAQRQPNTLPPIPAESVPGIIVNGNTIRVSAELGRPQLTTWSDRWVLLYSRKEDIPPVVEFSAGAPWTPVEQKTLNTAKKYIAGAFGADSAVARGLSDPGMIQPRLYEVGIGTPQSYHSLAGVFVRSTNPAVDKKIFLNRSEIENPVSLMFTLAEEGYHSQDSRYLLEKERLPLGEAKRRAELRAAGARDQLYKHIMSHPHPPEWNQKLEVQRKDIEDSYRELGRAK